MPTRNINLTEHSDGFIADQLSSGHYKNASEVVRAGLRLLEQQEAENAAKLDALREANAIGMAAYERGDYTTVHSDKELDQVFEGIWARIDK